MDLRRAMYATFTRARARARSHLTILGDPDVAAECGFDHLATALHA